MIATIQGGDWACKYDRALAFIRLMISLLSGQADGGGGDPLAPAAEAEAVGGLGGDADLGRPQAEGLGQVGPPPGG